jgi:predicted sulfurtransferase
LEKQQQQHSTATATTTTIIHLDVKYCLLREDLPIQAQLFETLMVKETKTVISLFDKDNNTETPSSNKNSNRRSKQSNRRRRRKEKRQQPQQEQVGGDDSCSNHPPPPLSTTITANTTLPQQETMLSIAPAPHLSASEWNHQLLLKKQQQQQQQRAGANNNNNNTALLLDVRNVYESRVGHFAVPHVPTLLTNTRKYSDLPQLLATNLQVQDTQEIFLYCTGGVRCERVSQLVQTLYPTKKVYQLQGGIQSYLRETATITTTTTTNSEEETKSYFKGKNFVFDPRRTDPVQTGVIGTCMMCKQPHDDYDNGHAPMENKEARCNTCRMLILVCNECRPNYTCWGENHQQQEDEDEDRPLLYCGGLEQCVHEGVAPEPELIVQQDDDNEP